MGMIQGGKTVYGDPKDGASPLGILILETRFPRLPGDIGHAATFDFPVLYGVVSGAHAAVAVRGRAEDLVDAFIESGQELVADGAVALTTSCGFLAPLQRQLSEACSVPVAASSLLQAAPVQQLLPAGQCVGILTVDATALTEHHLQAAGVPAGSPVGGPPSDSEFTSVYVGDRPAIDPAKAEQDLCTAAETLCSRHPSIGALVLECTNMGPWSAAIVETVQRPVYDIRHLLTWFRAGIATAQRTTKENGGEISAVALHD